MDLFIPVLPPERLHPSFVVLMNGEAYSPARGIIREVFESYHDIDGNFIEQFQSTGFDARIWELYLYSYLKDQNFTFDIRHARPDFVVQKKEVSVCIEAVTANLTQSDSNHAEENDQGTSDVFERLLHTDPIKLGSPLYSKLKKKYWELEHVQGRPLIIAIEDFHEKKSLTHSSAALSNYLYGFTQYFNYDEMGNSGIKTIHFEKHTRGSKEIPTAFFELPDSENISAVIFSNSGTITKFNRMGQLGKYRSDKLIMIRDGLCYNPEENSNIPLRFKYIVGDPNFPEAWGQGISVFHNPNAKHPVAFEIFEDVQHLKFKNGLIANYTPLFFPISSITLIFELTNKEPTSS